MTHTHSGEVRQENVTRSEGRLPLAGVLRGALLVALLVTVTPWAAFAQDSATVPEGMAYIPFGPSIMGIDKDPANAPTVSEPASLYQRRMSMPWSKEAFHDEGPAHWVVVDGYFIDKYEVSNKDYAEFMKTKGHPGPAYWDDPVPFTHPRTRDTDEDGYEDGIEALIMGTVNDPRLYYRRLGSGAFTVMEMTHVARGVYRATIPGQKDDFEWYVTANTSLGDVIFPATAGAPEAERIYQTVIVSGALIK